MTVTAKNRRDKIMSNQISFEFNRTKAIEAILWIANQNSGQVDVYKVVKGIFFADLFHLNKYGRPIAGDHYLAMPHGPVPAMTYNIIQGNPLEIEGELPFKRERNIITPDRSPNLTVFSKSDLEALRYGWDKVKDLSFSELKSLADDHPAYVKTWKNRTSDADIINFSGLIDDKAKVAELRELAPTIKI